MKILALYLPGIVAIIAVIVVRWWNAGKNGAIQAALDEVNTERDSFYESMR